MRSETSSTWMRPSTKVLKSGGIHVLGMLMLLSAAQSAAGQAAAKPETELLVSVKAAIKNGKTQKSRMLGFSIPKVQFEEIPPEGALLIGFEIGLVKDGGGEEEICTLSPIYLTARGEQSYQTFGSFPTPPPRKSTKSPPPKNNFSRMVRLKANPGYAVGGIHIHTAIKMHAMALTCMRITTTGLDPQKSYLTEWVGNQNGGGPSSFSCDGAPIVGVYGHHDKQMLGLGAMYTGGKSPAKLAVLPVEPQVQQKTEPQVEVRTEPLVEPQVEVNTEPPVEPQVQTKPAKNKTNTRAEAQVNPRSLPKQTKYRSDERHFSFTPAQGWVSMSKAELAAIDQFVQKMGMGGKIRYEGGLRPAGSRMGSYPYALIQFTPIDTRKTTYAEIQKAIGKDFSAPMQEIKGAIGDLAKKIAVGKPVLDRDNNRILLRMDMDLSMFSTTKIQAFSVCHLGLEGIAAIHCYAFEKDFDRLTSSFTFMNDTFSFDDGFEFVANDTAVAEAKAKMWNTWMPYLAFGGAALGIVLCSGFFISQRRRPGDRIQDPDLAKILEPAKFATNPVKAPAAPPIPVVLPAGPPQFFVTEHKTTLGGARTMRVYTLPNELLFIDAGPSSSSTTQQTATVAGAAVGGLVGGIVGGTIGGMMSASNREQAGAKQFSLDVADYNDLQRIVDADRNSFRATNIDLMQPKLEPPSYLDSWGTKIAGCFTFEHRDRGKYRLQFLTSVELQKAVNQLPAVLGEELVIEV